MMLQNHFIISKWQYAFASLQRKRITDVEGEVREGGTEEKGKGTGAEGGEGFLHGYFFYGCGHGEASHGNTTINFMALFLLQKRKITKRCK